MVRIGVRTTVLVHEVREPRPCHVPAAPRTTGRTGVGAAQIPITPEPGGDPAGPGFADGC